MTEAAEGENAGARDREHAKEEESAFTRIPIDPSRPPLWSARLTLRRASLQVGHATTHRSTLSRTLSLRLSRASSSPSLSLSPSFHLLLPPPPPLSTTTVVIIIGAAATAGPEHLLLCRRRASLVLSPHRSATLKRRKAEDSS